MTATSRWPTITALLAFAGCIIGLGFTDPRATPGLAFTLYAAAHALLYLQVFHLWPRGQRWCRYLPLLLLLAVVWRLAFLPWPVNDDIYRYIWEGRQVAAGADPYLRAPAELAIHHAGDPVYEQINHPDVPAIYPPLTLITFAGISRLADAVTHTTAGVILVYKSVFLAVDLLVIGMLVALLRHWRRPPWWIAIYAWNPLVLVYGIGEAHFDILLNAWLALALLGLARHGVGFLALGCAIMTKYFPLILVPFLTSRRNLRWLPLLLLPALLFLPFAGFGGLRRFGTEFHVHDLLPRLVRLVADGPLYTLLLALALGGGLACIWLIKQDAPLHSLVLAWAWLLICLPTVHPWYLLPMVMLMTLAPSRAWLLLCATVGLQFWILHQQALTGIWHSPPWLWWAMYLPVGAMLLYDSLRPDRPWRKHYPEPRSLDIVMPVLNEAGNLPATLAALQAASDRADWREIRLIVVDGGSDDTTVAIARDAGCHVIEGAPRGRGNQFAEGIAAGSADWILMLHADAIIAPTALANLRANLRAQPAVEWGILGHIYDHRSWRLRLVELSNRLRFNVGGIAFGDQGIFVRRDVLATVGGMPRVRLMEDVEVSLRLASASCRLELGAALEVSTRRWRQQHFSRYTAQVLALVSSYLVLRRLGLPLARLTDLMYRWYYGRS